MEKTLFFNENLIKTMTENSRNIILFLIKENIDFFITVEKDVIDFQPPLPNGILPESNELIILHIINYGMENIHIENNEIIVEMGFGPNNFGSVLHVPLWSVFQINIGNHINKEPLLINILGIKATEINEHLNSNNGINNSTNIFLNNPENENLFK